MCVYLVVQIRSLYPPSLQICFWLVQPFSSVGGRVSVVNIRRVFLSRSISVFIRQFRILQEAFSSVGACAEQFTSLFQCRSFEQNVSSFRNADVASSTVRLCINLINDLLVMPTLIHRGEETYRGI